MDKLDKDLFVRFRKTRTPWTYARQVVFRSTVVDMYGASCDPEVSSRRAYHLIADWRALVCRLFDAGWSRLTSRVPVGSNAFVAVADPARAIKACNCYPAATSARPLTWHCRYVAICPHCWGRRTLSLWRAVDSKLFPKTPKPENSLKPKPRALCLDPLDPTPKHKTFKALEGWVLVHRSRRFRIGPVPTALATFFAMRHGRGRPDKSKGLGLPTCREDQRKLMKLGVVGGFEFTQLQPRILRNGQQRGWYVFVRQLLWLPADRYEAFADPSSWAQAKPVPKSRLEIKPLFDPTRKQIMHAFAAVCRYPDWILRQEDVAMVMAYCDAIEGRRLATRFGTWRGDD